MNNDMNNQVPNNNMAQTTTNVTTTAPANNNVPNVNYNPTPQVSSNDNKGGNNKLIIIIVVIVALVAIVFGVVVLTSGDSSSKNDDKKTENKTSEDTDTSKDDNEDKEEDSANLYAFSTYENYTFTMDIEMEMDYDGSVISVTTYSEGKADVKNKTHYMVTRVETLGVSETSYSYNDIASGYAYTSSDQKNWTSEKNVDGADDTIELEDIINKINNNDSGVAKEADGHYRVKVDYAGYENVYAEVYVSDGYVTRVYYDLSSVVVAEGFSKFTVDIKLSKFNQTGDVVIPQTVVGSTSANA